MRLITSLAILPLLYSIGVCAEEATTEIISEPPKASVTIVTNAWTTRFAQKIEDFKREGYSPENISKAQLEFDEIKRKNPSKVINCITPCIVNIPFTAWKRSEITAIKNGFPDYSADLISFSKINAKSAPQQINLVFTTPETVPQSCVFDVSSVFKNRQKEQPCYRPKSQAPRSLKRKKLSYKCLVEFDLDDTGKTENIQITNCPQRKLKKLVLENVKSWRYVPRVETGKTVAVKGVRSQISYIYYDKNGKRYPVAK